VGETYSTCSIQGKGEVERQSIWSDEDVSNLFLSVVCQWESWYFAVFRRWWKRKSYEFSIEVWWGLPSCRALP
jgi:hypothetical protein